MVTIATTSALERLLARFWADTLRKEDADFETDFFGAGGRAREARRLLTLIKGAFNLSIPADTLRKAPTVRAFAGALRAQVDHPGRLERLAERLLLEASQPSAHPRQGHGAGATW
jgi:hypothetical protein